MAKIPKLMSKFYRLEISDDIRKLISSLPFSNLRETQIGNHVYLGNGEIKIGSQLYPIKIRIWDDEGIKLSLQSPLAGLNVEYPFPTGLERRKVIQNILQSMDKCLN